MMQLWEQLRENQRRSFEPVTESEQDGHLESSQKRLDETTWRAQGKREEKGNGNGEIEKYFEVYDKETLLLS